jgi:hypothetical protein
MAMVGFEPLNPPGVLVLRQAESSRGLAAGFNQQTDPEDDVDDIAKIFGERGDLAHLALFLWASGASGLLVWALRELAASNRRFNDFVNEIARLNRFFSNRD